MIRRARLSFKPNVRPSGRSVGTGARDGLSASQPEESVQPGDITVIAGLEENDKPDGGGGSTQCVADSGDPQRDPDIPEKAASTSSQHEPSKAAIAPLQRRKRISTLPNLAKPRVSSSAPVTPSQKPQQADSAPTFPVSSVPSKDNVSPPEKAKVPSAAKSQGPISAPQGQHVTLPEKRTPIPQVPQFSPYKKASLKQSELSPIKSVDFAQKEDFSPLKERPSQKSTTNECKNFTPKKLVASGNLEKERVHRAQKLRELLKDELRKERKEWRAKHPVITNIGEMERSKMVMRDFIYFIPENNPMTSSFAETKSSEKAPTDSQLSGTPVKNINNEEDDDLDEEKDDSQLLAPRVKVAEDGSIILDEESLTVEVSRSKAPIVEGNDPIFERGSTTTYSSFRKSNYSKPWSEEETDMFYLAISMVGTDFTMISQLFPHRERIEIKNKFKREERASSWRIDKAFREKITFDFEFFSKRMERALEAAKRRRMAPKVRQPREKKAAKPRKKQKDKASAEQVLSDGEMTLLSDGEEADDRTEEKENEGSLSVKDSLLPSDNVPVKKRRSRKKKNDTKEPEEETHESLLEDTTAMPKKTRKSRAADQVKDSELTVNAENLEDGQAAPDTVREKKKKSRKKKFTDKEAETENTGDGDTIDGQSPQMDGVDGKSASSALPDDADLLTCRESGEPSFTQSEALTCAEESSLILFTEERECFSEPDDISSLQESLSMIPGLQTLADQTGTFDDVPGETSQEDSVFDSSHYFTSDSPKHVPPEEELALDTASGTKVEESTEPQRDSLFRPAALTRSRFQRPRPNVPVRTLARQENILVPGRDGITEERNEVTVDNLQSQSHEDMRVTENPDYEELELSVTGTPKKDVIPPVQKKSSSESSQLQPESSDIDPPEFDAAKEDISKEKPLPVRGRLIRPKPNLKTAPAKDKPPDPEQRSPPESDPQDSKIATIPCSVVLQSLCTSTYEEKALKEKAESRISSHEQCTESTIKPAPLVQGCSQSPKPSTVRTSRKEKCEDIDSEKRDEVSAEDATGDISSTLASCIQNDAAFGNHEEQDNISTHEDKCLDFAAVQDSCIQFKKTLSKPCISVQDVIQEPDPVVSMVSVSKAESKKSPIKLARGPLPSPMPNLLKSCDRKRRSETREEKTDVTSENTGKDLEGKTEDLSDLGKPTDLLKEVSTSDGSCGHQENRMVPADMDQVLPRDSKSEVDVNLLEDVQKPTKPAVLTRGRLQRPKPNLGRTLPKRGVLSSSDDSKNESEVKVCEKPPKSSQSATSLPHFEAEEAPVLGKAGTEEITQSNVLSLETIDLPGVDQVESEESPSMFVDNSTRAIIKKELSGSEEEKCSVPTKPALTRSRLLRPKPNLGSSVTRPTVSSQKCDVHEEGKRGEDGINTSSMENNDGGNVPILANTDAEDTASPEEITQSYILPLETIVLPGGDQMDSEEPASVPVDDSSHVTAKKDFSPSEDERMEEPSSALTRSRLQRPKPNLGRSVKRPVVSAPQKCHVYEKMKTTKDSTDTSSIQKSGTSRDKQNVKLPHESCPSEGHNIQLVTEETQDGSLEGSAQLKESSCPEEQGKGPSVKPQRNRLQKPKPNLGRASVRKESKAFTSEQEEVNFHSSSKIPEHLDRKEGPGLALTKDAVGGNRAESAHTTIKPAQLRRGRLVRPVPTLGKPSNKRPSALQSKIVNEEEESSTDKDLEVSSSKRKASECFPDVSPKRSCPDLSQGSSDSALDQVPSTSALQDSSQSNDILEDNKQQHSRFGRPLKRPLSATPAVLTKPSENVSERPEKEKTSRNVKSVKSKVTKPTSSKGKGKTTLVKIRAMKQDEDDDDDDGAELELEDEDYDIAPDKLNQAPVFVPFSLRSPKPVPAEIEETVEELEIPMEDLGVPFSTPQRLRTQCLTLQDMSQLAPVSQADPDKKGHCDGSTEAAMALISMGNFVVQSNLGKPLDSDQHAESQLSSNTDCKPEAPTLSVQMVCAAEDDSTINTSPLKICHETVGLQVGNGSLSVSTDEQSNDLVISDRPTSQQSSHLMNVNVTLPLEQTSCTNLQDDAKQQDCSMSDGGSGEETTFILTLVEIPVSEGYSYSCDENSVDVLPAPVLITSGSSHVLTPDQSSGTAASSEVSTCDSCPSGQVEAKLIPSPPSWKRSASISSDTDEPQPYKRALLCTSVEQGENHRSSNAAFEENEKSSSVSAESNTEETKESHQSSIDVANSSTDGEKVPVETEGSHLSSIDVTSSSAGGEKVPKVTEESPQRSNDVASSSTGGEKVPKETKESHQRSIDIASSSAGEEKVPKETEESPPRSTDIASCSIGGEKVPKVTEESHQRSIDTASTSTEGKKVPNETEESHQGIETSSSPTGEEKIPECTTDSERLSRVAHVKKPATASSDLPSRRLPSSSSRKQHQRSGRKPLGFLSLVCKEKQSKKTKVTSKKSVSKPKCKKAKFQEQSPTGIDDDAPSSEVPSQSSSSTVTSAATITENRGSENLDTVHVFENLDNITQESPKSQDLATEEEAATVSEYFFSDIFMEVDE